MRRLAVSASVIAIALLLGSPARSAPVTFDLTGVVGWWVRSTDPNAAIPGPPTNGGVCTPGMATGAGNDCFRYAFGVGSSVSIDITGSAVTMLGGTLIVDAVTPLALNTIVLTMHHETTIAGGATGTLAGDSILWSSQAYINTFGSISCTGSNCEAISMPQGAVFAWEPQFSLLTGTTGAPWLWLMQWDLDPSHTSIVASSPALSRRSNITELGNRNSAMFTFGPRGLGLPVCDGELPGVCEAFEPPPWPDEAPEPAPAALVLLGIAALVLRVRSASSR